MVGVSRSREATEAGYGDTYTKKADDGTVIAKVVAPAPAVWDAVLAALIHDAGMASVPAMGSPT